MITTTNIARLNAFALTALLLGAPLVQVAGAQTMNAPAPVAQDKNAPAVVAPAEDTEEKTVHFSLVGGGQFRQDEKLYDSKFEQYREVPQGALMLVRATFE